MLDHEHEKALLRARIVELEGALKAQQRVVLTDPIPDEALIRFWAKVDKSGGPDACWPWVARSERFHLTKTQAISPRRLSWRLAFGDAPFEIALLCRNKVCVNPMHFVQDEVQKFWSLVNKEGPVLWPNLGPCWEWQGGRGKRSELGEGKSYGAFAPRTDVIYPAHRYSYELAYGKIAGHIGHDAEHEICVLHHCDNPPCVRPEHLWLGSDKDNIHDMIRKGRHPTSKRIPGGGVPTGGMDR